MRHAVVSVAQVQPTTVLSNRNIMKKIDSALGFTLIELLVTVAISLIVIGGSLAGFMTLRAHQEVLTMAGNMRNFYVTAQGKARVRESPYSATDTCNLTGYRVQKNGNSLDMQALCGGTPFGEITSMDISGLTVTFSPTSSVTFYSLPEEDAVNKKLKYTSLPSTLTVTVTDSSYPVSFTISTTGAISDVQKP